MRPFIRSGLVLKNYRVNTLDYTQAEFGAPFSMHTQFVSNFERGICLPPVPIMTTLLNRPNFPRSEFEYALKQDLFETQMRKYITRRPAKRKPTSKTSKKTAPKTGQRPTWQNP